MNTLKLNVSPQLVTNTPKVVSSNNFTPVQTISNSITPQTNSIQYAVPNPVQYQTPVPTNTIIYQPVSPVQYQTVPISNVETPDNFNINLKPIVPLNSNNTHKTVLGNVNISDNSDTEYAVPPKSIKSSEEPNDLSNDINLDKIIKTSADLEKIEDKLNITSENPNKKTKKKIPSYRKKTKNKFTSKYMIRDNTKLVFLILLYTGEIIKYKKIKISDISKNIVSENDVIQIQQYINTLSTEDLEIIKKYAYGKLENKLQIKKLNNIIINPKTRQKKSITVFKELSESNNPSKNTVYKDLNSNIFYFNPFYNWNIKQKKSKKILKLILKPGTNILVYYKKNIFNDGIAILPSNIKYKVTDEKILKYTNLTAKVYTLNIL